MSREAALKAWQTRHANGEGRGQRSLARHRLFMTTQNYTSGTLPRRGRSRFSVINRSKTFGGPLFGVKFVQLGRKPPGYWPSVRRHMAARAAGKRYIKGMHYGGWRGTGITSGIKY